MRRTTSSLFITVEVHLSSFLPTSGQGVGRRGGGGGGPKASLPIDGEKGPPGIDLREFWISRGGDPTNAPGRQYRSRGV